MTYGSIGHDSVLDLADRDALLSDPRDDDGRRPVGHDLESLGDEALVTQVDLGLDRLEAGDERRAGREEPVLPAAGRNVEGMTGRDLHPSPSRHE